MKNRYRNHRFFLKCTLILVAAFFFSFFCCPAVARDRTIVPEKDRISDFEARLELAKILSYNNNTLEEALSELNVLAAEQPGNRDVLLNTGNVYLRLKRYNEAAKRFRAILAKDSDNPDATFALARIYLWTGRYEDAIRLFNDIPKKHAVGDEFYAELGDAYLYAGRFPDAIENYKKALELNPSSDSIKKKLALALSWNKDNDQALPLLRELAEKHPDNKEIILELARTYARTYKPEKALAYLYDMLKKYPRDPSLLVETAYIEASSGHAKKCRDLFNKALTLANNSEKEKLLLDFASVMSIWGSFYRIERIYRDYLKNHPDSFEYTMKLAGTLTNAQQYENAEGVYRKLLFYNPENTEALLGLARLKFQEKDFDASLMYAKRVLAKDPLNTEAVTLSGESYLFLNRLDNAIKEFSLLTMTDSSASQGFIGIGKAYLKKGNQKEAQLNFKKAWERNPSLVETQFYNTGFRILTKKDFVETILKNETKPVRLTEWAHLYAKYGYFAISIRFLEKALEIDPEYFPAEIALAQTMSIASMYKEATDRYAGLHRSFPESSKILIEWARMLGWSKHYEDSIELYRKIRKLNPDDPIPGKEMARVAMWGKMVPEAMATYKQMLMPPVDKELLVRVTPVGDNSKDDMFRESVARLHNQVDRGSIYEGYEGFLKDFRKNERSLTPDEKKEVELALIDTLSGYLTQKAVFLESTAKHESWNKHFYRSMPYYEELIGFNPGNEEAYFDYAQTECSLGLCDAEKKTYEQLLNIDPLHSLAKTALDRQKIRSNPSILGGYTYWMEDGHGDTSQITRNRFDLNFDFPIFCRYHLNLALHRWYEKPWYNHRNYGATGYTFGFDGALSPLLKAHASVTHKQYDNTDFSSRDTGKANLWFNFKEYVHLGAGYEKTDEIYNYFGMEHGTQANNWWLGFRSDLTRRLELSGMLKAIYYNDSNNGQHHSLSLGYAVTDHPKIFKVTLSGDYRDTKHESTSIYQGPNLVDIIHPYWTPQNYTGGGVSFEWYHDYSGLFFCGNELRFYDIRVSFGTDSENNPSAKIEGEWHHQFYDHWTINLKGMLHSSPKWDANGFWAYVKYQF